MKLDNYNPASSIIDLAISAGFCVDKLIAFTRRSTIIGLNSQNGFDVLKIFFGSDHVLDVLPVAQKASAYGFYWYASKSEIERTYEREAVESEIAVTSFMSGQRGWPVFLGSGIIDNVRYMRLQHVSGDSFYFPDIKKGVLNIKALCVIFKIAESLQQLHFSGFVHRDIYRENIMVSGTNVTVIDLGAAKKITERVGPKSKGPEPHWPPEYLTCFDAVDQSADIYSLGVLLHRTLTGDIPRPWSSKLLKEINEPQLENLVLSCLSECCTDRPNTNDIAKLLQNYS